MSLRDFVDSFKIEVVELKDTLPPTPELTRRILPIERQGKIVIFKVLGSDFQCVSGALGRRNRLYQLLGAQSDEEAYSKLLAAIANPNKAKSVEFWNYFTAFTLDVNKLPFVKFFPRDGGRYATSAIFIACLDEVCNASIHRTMIVEKDKLVARIVPRHLRYIYNEYRKQGRDLPVAIVIGAHPAALLAAASSPPFGVFELDVATAILPELRIAYTPRYGIPVPVPAAVIIEARITGELVDEGPFVDLLGLYDRVRKEPLIRIDSMYVNLEEPFHIIMPSGNEHIILQSFYREALIWDSVRKVVPRVKKVRLIRAGGGWLYAVISITKIHEGDAKNAILAAFAAHPSLKIVVAVDEDIDPDDIESVEWAIATRVQASRDLIVIRRARCSTLDPSSDDGLCDKLGIDATVSLTEDRSKYVHAYSDLWKGDGARI